MKVLRFIFIILTGVMLITACEKFLEKTPEASVSNSDIFGTYESFQGYLDPNYTELRSYNSHYNSSTMDLGGETSNSAVNWSQAWTCWTGDYWTISGSDDPTETTSLFHAVGYGYGENGTSGIWTGGWRGIRVCNNALKNFSLLSEATDEEKQLLLGQIHFFRAFFHHQIIDAFGGMPYINSVFSPNDEMKLPRLTYQETAEEIVKDYDKAIELLPETWDQTARGSQSPGSNTGRATKGAALAYKAKLLLYAGSPLMNK
ncbi:MAG: starch-binding outer membrane protein SusD/RagB family, partial [Bacteroidota bacterium]|nr:starch-binding outer membrane protein SusD/RagB family [Bacteroidota bacterium]